jgi:hypothetical protein
MKLKSYSVFTLFLVTSASFADDVQRCSLTFRKNILQRRQTSVVSRASGDTLVQHTFGIQARDGSTAVISLKPRGYSYDISVVGSDSAIKKTGLEFNRIYSAPLYITEEESNIFQNSKIKISCARIL